MKLITSLIAAFVMFGVIFSFLPSTYAQTSDVETSEQTTLLGDLLNNSAALEILEKIEESKRKIAKLEQQNYDNLQAQKFLEERRAVALERLNQALVSWEEKWHEFSPKVAYQKFIDKMPSSVQGIYAKQFEFTESKHELGVTAKSNALDDGFISYKAQQKFNSAARSTISELDDYNETIQPDTPKEISTKIAIIQGDIDTLNAGYFYQHAKLKGELNAKYVIEVENERKELRAILQDYYSNYISGEDLSKQLGEIREKYTPIKENILDDNSKILVDFEKQFMDRIQNKIKSINNNEYLSSLIEAEWNSEIHST